MKILRVITSMNPSSGGPCQGIRNSIPHLKKMGIENEVVCLDDEIDNYEIKDDFKIHKLGRGKTSFQYHSELINWLENNLCNYDALIVDGIWQFHNYAVYKAIKRAKQQSKKIPKVIIMPHGMLDPYFQKDPSRKWKALRNKIVWEFTEKWAINGADAIFFTCQEELFLARKTFGGYHPKKEINVGYGIQPPPLQTDKMLRKFNKKTPLLKNNYLLFLSRIHPKKGLDLLIMAYNIICKQNQNIQDLVIAGPTDSEYAQKMIALAKNNPKIHFAGMLKEEAKWGAFYGCDAYLLPSHQENFGISIVEAMACAKPVLITKQVNIWREIEAGNGGWILETSTVENIVKILKTLSGLNLQQFEQMGNDAYMNFEKKFNMEQQVAVLAKAVQAL